MLRRAFVLLSAQYHLLACLADMAIGPPATATALGRSRSVAARGEVRGPAGQQVAILLPLSGAPGRLGQNHAAGGAARPGWPGRTATGPRKILVGQPQGAAAGTAAIADGVGLILGPLTSTGTAAVAPIARSANVAPVRLHRRPVTGAARRLDAGHHPRQTVPATGGSERRVREKSEFARLLRTTTSATLWGQALTGHGGRRSAGSRKVHFYAKGMPAINAAARDLSGYASRRGPIDAQITPARELRGRRKAVARHRNWLSGRSLHHSFNTLLLADTGEALAEIAAVLPFTMWIAPSTDPGTGAMG